MRFTKELAFNIGLAFLAGFVASFGAFAAKAGEVPPQRQVLFAAGAAAVWAGVRGVAGFLALNFSKVPTIPVDE